eukprot:TRINITY_DN122_c0_g1_i2.p1 TRINITY_DN122_c0_g1~~TRINITY_DN122_c0_g1_i2.p1  ORF type:complete len:222 (-),score=90.17 TRINITY_DN122_c0_g1_i2:90-755(-)
MSTEAAQPQGGSKRKDGSVRPAVKVKPGWVGDLEKQAYEAPGKKKQKETPNQWGDAPVGALKEGEAAPKQQSQPKPKPPKQEGAKQQQPKQEGGKQQPKQEGGKQQPKQEGGKPKQEGAKPKQEGAKQQQPKQEGGKGAQPKQGGVKQPAGAQAKGQKKPGPQVPLTAEGKRKRIRALNKRLREVARLEERRATGEKLTIQMKTKIDKRPAFESELQKLQK